MRPISEPTNDVELADEFGVGRDESDEPRCGHLLQLSDRRQLAFHLHGGLAWVADFVDGVGELIEATVWFRDQCGRIAMAYPHQRLTLDAAVPIPPSMFDQIESLHRDASRHHGVGKFHIPPVVHSAAL